MSQLFRIYAPVVDRGKRGVSFLGLGRITCSRIRWLYNSVNVLKPLYKKGDVMACELHLSKKQLWL